jgi:hypothetical protein
MPVELLVDALEFHLPGTSKETRRRLEPMLRERMVTLADARRLAAPLLGEPEWDPKTPFPPPKVDAAAAVQLLDACIAAVGEELLEQPDVLLHRLRTACEAAEVKPRDGFRVLYMAILGAPSGVPVIEAMAFLGSETSLARLTAARARLKDG